MDDASVPDEGRFSEERWRRLQEPLVAYVQRLPKALKIAVGDGKRWFRGAAGAFGAAARLDVRLLKRF